MTNSYYFDNGELLDSQGNWVSWDVAENPEDYPEVYEAYPDLLARLEDGSTPYVRAIIAQRTDITADLLEKLRQDKAPEVQRAIASRPDTPIEVFRKLAKIPLADIATAIARNPATPLEILELMMKSRCGYARLVLVNRDDCTTEMLDILVHDKHSERVATAVVFRPNASADALAVHATHRFYSIRVAIASHVNTSGETLDLLSRDADIRVREAVEANPHFVPGNSGSKMTDMTTVR